MDSARIGEIAGAKTVTFHPAFFQKQDKKEVLERVAKELNEMRKEIKKNKWKIALAPETMGRESQLGSLQETIELCRLVKGIQPLIDWSHLHARGNGRFKKKEDFLGAIDEIPKKFLKDLQMHVSGIKYGGKGEQKHLNMQEKENTFNYKWFLEALKEKKVSGCIVCESPNNEEDALLMQRYSLNL